MDSSPLPSLAPIPANSTAAPATAGQLDHLESEAMYILREAAAEFSNPVLLFSGGKDSTVLLRLAEKAFRPGKFPFPLMHVDTGQNFPEVIEFRDRIAQQLGERLIVRTVQDSIDRGRVRPKHANQSRNSMQTVTLLDAIKEFGFDCCIGGARRDEEKARAKERIFSFRNSFGEWDPRHQRPELWSLYNGRLDKGEHMRVFPLSNWTEIDIWRYTRRENIPIIPLYLARNGKRYRSLGDQDITSPITSKARTIDEIIAELEATNTPERAGRAMDHESEDAFERLRTSGYL